MFPIPVDASNISLSGKNAALLNATTGSSALANLEVIAPTGSLGFSNGANFPSAGQFINTGTLSVGSGSTFSTASASLLNFSGTTLSGGTYDVAGTLEFAGANIVTNAASITLSGTSSQILNSTTAGNALANLAVNAAGGSFTLAGDRNFTTAGSFTNNGTLGIGSGSTLAINGSLTNVSGTTLNGGTYEIGGTLKFAGANVVTNAATLSLAGGSAKFLNSTTGGSALANLAANAASGSFSLSGGQTFTSASAFANAGTISIGTGSTFTVGGSGAFTQTGGKLTDDGTLAASGGVSLSSGGLLGTGKITGALTSSASITPGASPASTGILSDTGTYTQNAAGALNIVIGGTTAGAQYDELTATSAKLGGTLNISLANGYVPTVGSTFKIVGYGSETGEFATVNGLAINGSEHFALTYQGTDLLATVVSGAATSVASATPASAVSASNASMLSAAKANAVSSDEEPLTERMGRFASGLHFASDGASGNVTASSSEGAAASRSARFAGHRAGALLRLTSASSSARDAAAEASVNHGKVRSFSLHFSMSDPFSVPRMGVAVN